MATRKRKQTQVATPEVKEPENDEDRIISKYKDRISNPLTAIRSMCVECMGGSVQAVSDCPSVSCSLHPFRMGKNTMHGSHGKAQKNNPNVK